MKVYIRSKRTAFGRDGHPALSCQPDGTVQANRFGPGKEWEEWILESVETKDGTSAIALRSWMGMYLSAKDNGEVRVDRSDIGENEKWIIENKDDGYVSMKSASFGKYLVRDNLFLCGDTVKADRDDATEWEQWMVVENDPNALSGNLKKAIYGRLMVVGTVVTVGAVAIPLAGFTAGGVAVGSLAAVVQSIFYGGATCGVFSILQSVGATLAWVPAAAGGTAVATAGAVGNRIEGNKNNLGHGSGRSDDSDS